MALIELLNELNRTGYFTYNLNPDGETLLCKLHCRGNVEGLFPEQHDIDAILLLEKNGFVRENRIDCRNRTEDRFDSIIYHYRRKFPELTPADVDYCREYRINPYEPLAVNKKYGVK